MKRATDAEIEAALVRSIGNLTVAAKSLGISRFTIYRRMERSPRIRTVYDTARESMIDNVESSLYRRALGGDVTACIFILKTRGKDRGYVERHEISGPNGGPISHVTKSELDCEIDGLLEELADREKAGAARASAAEEVGLDDDRALEAAHADGTVGDVADTGGQGLG